MAKTYVVTAAAAVVRLADTERYLYKGAVVPEGVRPESIEHLRSIGLIAERGVAAGGSSGGGDELPAGDPSDAWTVAQLRAYAKAHDVSLGGASSKAEVLAALTGGAAAGGEATGNDGSGDNGSDAS